MRQARQLAKREEKTGHPGIRRTRSEARQPQRLSPQPASEWQKQALTLEPFTPFGASQRTVTVYNRQAKPFDFKAEATADWIRLSDTAGTVAQQHDLDVSIDWDSLPAGVHESSIYITGTGWGGATVHVKAINTRSQPHGFVEAEGTA